MKKERCTIRDISKRSSVSKTTVYFDLAKRLPKIDKQLYKEVRQVLDYNKEQRAIRGGLANKMAWRKRRKEENNEEG